MHISLDTWKMVKMREISVLAIVLAFHVICVLSVQPCTRPKPLDLPVQRINQTCPNHMCTQQAADGETCHCQIRWENIEAAGERNAGTYSMVRMFGEKDMCWEKTNDPRFTTVGARFVEDCQRSSRSYGCQWKDKIEICHSDDIDVAQAMCRQFNLGDAYEAVASSSARKLTRGEWPGNRILLAKLKCTQLPTGINNCVLEYLPDNIKECSQMVAHCWWNGCWQGKHSIKARPCDTCKFRYGQACKWDKLGATADRSTCTRQCFRCPDSWKGGALDGYNCFSKQGNAQSGTLTWEPHFRTIDGKHFDFQGQCSYYLMKHGNFNIVAKFAVCGMLKRTGKSVTCANEITVTSGSTVIRLGQGDDVSITYRGRNLQATKPFHNDNINYYLASSEFDAVDIWNGYKILWDRRAEYKVVIPPWNSALVEGLLGNMDGNPENDMTKPNGALEPDPVKFGDSWMVPGSCPPKASAQAPQNPVLNNDEITKAHNKGCKYMNHDGQNPNSDPFKNCSSNVAKDEKQEEYSNCLMDVATCDRDLDTCLCPSFEFMADYCQKNGEGVGNWREQMPDSLCKLSCDHNKNEIFRMDADPCTQTCDAIKYIEEKRFDCIKMEVEGCNCDDGMARNKAGVCINITDCPP